LILLAIDPSTQVFRFLEYRWLRRLGQISYGFYVFHDIFHVTFQKLVHQLLGDVPYAPLVVVAVALCVTTAIAYTSFRFFEAPFLRLKDRFTA